MNLINQSLGHGRNTISCRWSPLFNFFIISYHTFKNVKYIFREYFMILTRIYMFQDCGNIATRHTAQIWMTPQFNYEWQNVQQLRSGCRQEKHQYGFTLSELLLSLQLFLSLLASQQPFYHSLSNKFAAIWLVRAVPLHLPSFLLLSTSTQTERTTSLRTIHVASAGDQDSSQLSRPFCQLSQDSVFSKNLYKLTIFNVLIRLYYFSINYSQHFIL